MKEQNTGGASGSPLAPNPEEEVIGEQFDDDTDTEQPEVVDQADTETEPVPNEEGEIA